MSLTYKQAKKLKNMGFPMKKALPNSKNIWGGKDTNGIVYEYPTLSELKKACGKEFENVVKYSEPGIGVWWQAYMTEKAFHKTGIACVRDCDGYATGDTPDEAVAELWKFLNKKHNYKFA